MYNDGTGGVGASTKVVYIYTFQAEICTSQFHGIAA